MIPKSYHTSGTQRLKRAVKVLGSRTIDQRTSMGKALAAYRDDLIADLGGAENLSRQEHLLVEEVIITTLLLSSVNAWLLAQKSLVSKKTRGVIAATRRRAPRFSNCVINLSGDKDRVFAEALRVLRPGGRFAVSDIVVRGEVPVDLRRSIELWAGCIAGALEERDYRAKLEAAGFDRVDIEPTRIYTATQAREFLAQSNLEEAAPLIDGKFMSAFVRARKPSRH